HYVSWERIRCGADIPVCAGRWQWQTGRLNPCCLNRQRARAGRNARAARVVPELAHRFYSSREDQTKSPRRSEGPNLSFIREEIESRHECPLPIYFFAGSALAYLRRKRSTRPAVSSNFCLPVKNGWQLAQISTLMSPLWVERVTNAFPQAQ